MKTFVVVFFLWPGPILGLSLGAACIGEARHTGTADGRDGDDDEDVAGSDDGREIDAATDTVSACPGGCPATGQQCLENVCDEELAACVVRARAGGSPCDDQDECTRVDRCGAGADAGTCLGSDRVVCFASDDCHDVGVCNPLSGVCSSPPKDDGALCEDAESIDDGARDASGTCEAASCRRLPVIALGASHGCAVFWNSAITCWGRNTSGELGLGHTESVGGAAGPSVAQTEPVRLPKVTAIGLGLAQTCVVTAGRVRCWGAGDGGALGQDDSLDDLGSGQETTPDRLDDVALAPGFVAVAVATTYFSSCALSDAGQVTCWGTETLGYPGVVAIGVPGAPPVAEAGSLALGTAGAPFSADAIVRTPGTGCALSDGRIRCWGGPANLGFATVERIGDDEPPSTAPILNPGWRATMLSAIHEHTCAVSEAGDVYCWGNNTSGQLGRLDREFTTDVVGPIAIGSDVRARAVATGQRHTCVLTREGGVRCWGNNSRGQLGTGQELDEVIPFAAEMADLGGEAVAIAAGWAHTCAVMREGAVKCFGQGSDGRLGNGSDDDVGNAPGDMPPAAIVFE